MIVTAGKTNVSVYYYIVGDVGNAAPGEPVTGLLFSDIETGGSASYARQGAARVDLELITLASASAAHANGGFILVDDTEMPGLYRCDYPDAAFAAGVDEVSLQIRIASGKNAVAAPIKVQLTVMNFRDGVRAGLTALPNAAADAAGGLAISDLGGLALDDIPITAEFEARTLAAAAYFDPGADDVAVVTLVATTTTNTDMVAEAPTAAEVNAEVAAALVTIHLDHLLAVDYDPASKPGVATALLNELIESDAGVSRYTVNALENGPSGTGASAAAIADAVWQEAQADHVAAGSFGIIASEIADILLDTNELQGDNVPGLIAALENLSAANVASELATYDGPTNAEMIARTLVAASYFDPVADAVAIAVGGIGATAFAAGAINAAATSTDFVDEIWDKICEDQGSYKAREILSINLAAAAGVTAGSVLKTPNGVTTRITATLLAEERTAITLVPSAGA